MDEVRRPEDGELCGFVAEHAGLWISLTVFGGALGEHHHETDARDTVLSEGLASLAERWTLTDGVRNRDEVVCILEANPSRVTVARNYSGPGVPTLTITARQLASGEWQLRR